MRRPVARRLSERGGSQVAALAYDGVPAPLDDAVPL